LEGDCEPVILVLRHIVQQRAPGAEIHDVGVQFSVVVVVGEAGAASYGFHIQNRTAAARDINKLSATEAAIDRVFLAHLVDQSAVEDENVEPAVVIEVVYAAAPTDVLASRSG